MFCSNCKKQIPNGSEFCLYCGGRLGETKEIEKETAAQMGQIVQKEVKKQYDQVDKNVKQNWFAKWLIIPSAIVVICALLLIVFDTIASDERLDDSNEKNDINASNDTVGAEKSVLIETDGKEKAIGLYKSYNFSKTNVGDDIRFGSYEQDRQPNGADPIEWLVLWKGNDRMLVLSKYGLDCQPYNSDYVDVTWENCSLRKWLDEQFYMSAFNESEKSMIAETKNINNDNIENGTMGGNDTIDRVFILSVEDVCKMEYGFDPDIAAYDEKRRCSPTEYAVSRGAYQYFGTGSTYITSEGKGAGFWWLRSPGKSSDYAASVNSRGYVRDYGDSVRVGANAVRPAMWIKIKSE